MNVFNPSTGDDCSLRIDPVTLVTPTESLHHAQRVVEGLIELGEAIAVYPLAGRVVPELSEEQVRERFLYSYRLIYEIRPERIDVLAILHGRRLLESIDERFKG